MRTAPFHGTRGPRLSALLPCLAGILAAGAAGTARAAAQVPPDAHWRTLRTDHFRVTFEAGLEPLARRVAGSAEAARSRLVARLGHPPATVDIVLADNVDITNGVTTAFPTNRIVLYARPPMDDLSLEYYRDWIDLLVTHELTHSFHLDVTGRVGRAIRTVFGRVPVWPAFPVLATPQWSLEGLAVQMESDLTGGGRNDGSFHEMVVRTAVLEHAFDPMSRLNMASSPLWPDAQRVYIYGSLFMDYLTRRYGQDVDRKMLDGITRSWLPPALVFDGVARHATGVSFDQAYADWQRSLEVRYAALADSLRLEGITTGEQVTTAGRYALYPRFSRGGNRLAYARADGKDVTRTAVFAVDGGEGWTVRRNALGPASWLPDGSAMITSQLEFDGPYHIYQDLYRFDQGGERRLTHGARLQDPDVARDGRRVIAVENGDGTSRLVVYSLDSGAVRPLTQVLPGIHWALPRWSPDGTRIAASRWEDGGFFDVVVLDTTGAVTAQITADVAVDNAPAWSPEGRYLLFSSDRSGIANLYAADLGDPGTRGDGRPGADLAVAMASSPVIRQVTNVLTGAFYPEVSPDRRWIYFSAYHADGFHLERMPFDPASWRAPAHLRMPITAGDREVGSGDGARHSNGAAATAAPPAAQAPVQARAGTGPDASPDRGGDQAVGGLAGPYSPLRSMLPGYWLPVILDSGAAGRFLGAATVGSDLVGRHSYTAWAALNTRAGRWQGGLGYAYAGLGRPVLVVSASREWDLYARTPLPDTDPPVLRDILEREDVVSLVARFPIRRVRSTTVLAVGPEYVARHRVLLDAPGYHLLDGEDTFYGAVASAGFADYRQPPFAISPEDGVSIGVSGRARWDTGTGDEADRGYREVVGQAAVYRSLPLGGFAHHVLALRAGGLVRTGPGATTAKIGGTSGTILDVAGIGVSSDSRLLPVRGFDAGVIAGTRAWTASAEYRLPLALVGRRPRFSPFAIDKVGATLFGDIGNASCTAEEGERLLSCGANHLAGNPRLSGTPLVSAGTELFADVGVSSWLAGRLRLGFAKPLHGPGGDGTIYVQFGLAF